MWLYGTAKAILYPIVRLLWQLKVEGTENVPPEGGVIVCGNHFHALDPVLVGITSPRRVSFMAKAELFEKPVIGTICRGLAAFPVKRGTPDRAALKRSIDLLQSGEGFGIFPEGTRNKTGTLKKAEPGTAYLALKSGAPVIPVGITATYKLFSPIIVRYGKPVNLEPFQTGKLSGDALEAAGEAIMAGIGEQLDPSVRRPLAAGKES